MTLMVKSIIKLIHNQKAVAPAPAFFLFLVTRDRHIGVPGLTIIIPLFVSATRDRLIPRQCTTDPSKSDYTNSSTVTARIAPVN